LSLIEHLEASNHAAVLERIFNGECNDVINEDLLKGLHRAIMQGIRHDAGMYSKFHRAIRGVDLIMPAPEDIQEEMDVLFKVINYKEKKTNTGCEGLIAHVAKMHASFEAIHPFGDGNGRIGRLIMIIQLLSEGYAPCVVENSCKGEYYEVLEYAQKRSETALIKFVAEAVLKGYKLLEKYEGR
jgi:Fic family protein